MDIDLLITLQNYGLSEKEAKVYLTLLELWSAPASSIARRSAIKRVTVYTLLAELKKKGFITEGSKNDVKFYSSISPEILLNQLEQKYEMFKSKVPELMLLGEKFWNKPKIQYFEAVAWIKTLYNELLLTHEPIYAFLSDDEIAPELQYYLNHEFLLETKKKKLKKFVILNNSKANLEYLKEVKKDPLTKIKVTDEKFTGLSWELMLFGENKVWIALYSPKEMMGFIIESKQLYASLFSIFDFIWKSI